MLLIAFSWSIILCFIGFQYLREKQYKSDYLSLQLQLYNRHLLEAVEQDGEPHEAYIDTHQKPFDNLRISIITLSGEVMGKRTRAIERKLRQVEALPTEESKKMLTLNDFTDDED